MRLLCNALSIVALCLICLAVMSADCSDDPNEEYAEGISVALECSPEGLSPPLGGFVSQWASALELGETVAGTVVEGTIVARNPDGRCYYDVGCPDEGVYGAVAEVTGFTAVDCGPGENPFTVTGLPVVLGPLESTPLIVRFAPNVAGEWQCRLEPEWSVLSTDYSPNPVSGFAHNCYISARGSAIAGPDPVCALDPPSAAFQYGSVEVGSSSDLTLTIRNETTDILTTNRFRYVLEDPVDQCGMFTIAPADTAGVLGPGESKDILVRFTPDAAGDFECTRSLASLKEPADPANPTIASACPATVTWRGTGVIGAPVWSDCSPAGSRDYHGVFGLSAAEVYAAGDAGVVVVSGGDCQWPASGTVFDSVDLKDIWGHATGTAKAVWAVGNIATSPPTGVILKKVEDGPWSKVDEGWLVSYGAVWGSGLDDVYFGGLGVATDWPNAKHWNGSVFDTLHMSEMGMSQVTGVSGTAGNDIWAVLGQSWNPVFRFQGGQWTSQNQAFMTKPLYDVWAVQGSDFYAVYAVGADGAIYHYDGSQWTDESIAGETRDFYGVWVSGTGQVFVVGEGQVVYHSDGASWSLHSLPADLPAGDLMDVWGSSDSDVYAVGTNGLILRYAPIGG